MTEQAHPTSHNQPEYSVSELSHALKRTVEDAYSFVRVRGEISGLKQAASGHVYLNLKDKESVLNAICWRGVASRLNFAPEDGLEVICTGRITTYGARSNYQMIVEHMEPAGVGALMALLEKRKKQLAKEGLFDASRKRPLPRFPTKIGVITSPTGAVIRDILHRLEDRFPCHVMLWPVLVQGDEAASQITAAIKGFQTFSSPPDLLIIARGGGSIEDLWPFNEENVVRATAACTIPTISAVGHETDTTLIDFASDQRAPTPTAAAEMAVPVKTELLQGLMETEHRISNVILRLLHEKSRHVEGLVRGLPTPMRLLEMKTQQLDMGYERLRSALPQLINQKQLQLVNTSSRIQHPKALLQQAEQRLQNGATQLRHSLQTGLERFSHKLSLTASQLQADRVLRRIDQRLERLQGLARLLDSFHYKKVLERGFALVRNKEGDVISDSSSLRDAGVGTVEFADGTIEVSVDGVDRQGELPL